MNEIFGIAVFIATLFGGTVVADQIYCSVREAALTKAAQGLPSLSRFSHALTSKPNLTNPAKAGSNQHKEKPIGPRK